MENLYQKIGLWIKFILVLMKKIWLHFVRLFLKFQRRLVSMISLPPFLANRKNSSFQAKLKMNSLIVFPLLNAPKNVHFIMSFTHISGNLCPSDYLFHLSVRTHRSGNYSLVQLNCHSFLEWPIYFDAVMAFLFYSKISFHLNSWKDYLQ